MYRYDHLVDVVEMLLVKVVPANAATSFAMAHETHKRILNPHHTYVCSKTQGSFLASSSATTRTVTSHTCMLPVELNWCVQRRAQRRNDAGSTGT